MAAAANSKAECQINAGVLWNSDAVTKGRWGQRIVIDCQEIIRKAVSLSVVEHCTVKVRTECEAA